MNKIKRWSNLRSCFFHCSLTLFPWFEKKKCIFTIFDLEYSKLNERQSLQEIKWMRFLQLKLRNYYSSFKKYLLVFNPNRIVKKLLIFLKIACFGEVRLHKLFWLLVGSFITINNYCFSEHQIEISVNFCL